MKARYPIFILEGPDGSGKSTLAGYLGGHYIHCTYNDDNKDDMHAYHMSVFYAAVHLAQHSHVVIDRWRMSEVVYGNVFRDGPVYPELTMDYYEMAYFQGATFVCCQPSDKCKYLAFFHEMKKKRKEMYDTVDEVYDEYNAQIHELCSMCVPVIYDIFSSPNPSKVLELGRNYFQAREARNSIKEIQECKASIRLTGFTSAK